MNEGTVSIDYKALVEKINSLTSSLQDANFGIQKQNERIANLEMALIEIKGGFHMNIQECMNIARAALAEGEEC